MKNVHVSDTVRKRIDALKGFGRAGRSKADKTTRIIEALVSGEADRPEHLAGGLTRHGENRIRGCRKYDLGGGYRLVTIKREDTLYVRFLGTHDECQQWLDHHSRMKTVPDASGNRYRVVPEDRTAEAPVAPEPDDPAGDDGDNPLRGVEDRVLRRLFSGIVAAAKAKCRRAAG